MTEATHPALGELLQPEDVLLGLDVADRHAFFCAIGDHMGIEHHMPPDWVARCLEQRERAGSTALGAGFAIPHARVVELDRIYTVYVRLKSPIDFDAPDDSPVSEMLVLLVPAPACPEHLALLAEAARRFANPVFRARLRACEDPQAVLDTFRAPVPCDQTGR